MSCANLVVICSQTLSHLVQRNVVACNCDPKVTNAVTFCVAVANGFGRHDGSPILVSQGLLTFCVVHRHRIWLSMMASPIFVS